MNETWLVILALAAAGSNLDQQRSVLPDRRLRSAQYVVPYSSVNKAPKG